MNNRFPKILVIIAVCILVPAILVGGAFACQHFFDPFDNRIVEGVTVGGLDVGGMTRGEAREALSAAALETVLVEDLTVSLPNETLTLSPYALEMELDVGKAVAAAFRVGRIDGANVYDLGLLPYLTLNRDTLRGTLESYANTYDTDLTQPVYSMKGDLPDLSTQLDMSTITCQTLSITLGLPDCHLDVEDALFRVLEVYDNAISECKAGTYGIQLAVPHTAEPEAPDLDAILEEFTIPAVDDSLSLETYGFVNGSYGYSFNLAAARRTVNIGSYGETVTIPMECRKPRVFGDGAYFRDVLGSCETKHNTNENRNNNLRLLSEALDGMILQPGEDFSYNEAIGERTAERGYLAAPAYSGNRLTDAIGGGVCQGSSTLYNCVLLADLEVTFRACHGATINYLPLGLDATVNWGTTDFTFRNNFNFPIKIVSEVSGGYLRMKILGTDEKDYYVKLEARSWDEEDVIYANSYKLKYDKETNQLISRDQIARSTYYKNIN